MIPGKEILFGKIALREGLISSLQLNDALSLQEFLGQYRPLGQIFIEQNVLTREQVDFILGLQRDYAATHHVAETLDDCQGLLFGTIAVLHNFCSEEKLHEALRVQATVERYIPVSLGEIMVKMGLLSNEQIAKILTLQQRAIFFCERCDIIFNYPCQEIDESQSPQCLECGAALKASRPSISRRYTVIQRSSSANSLVADAGGLPATWSLGTNEDSGTAGSGTSSSARNTADSHRLTVDDLFAAISAAGEDSDRAKTSDDEDGSGSRTSRMVLRPATIPTDAGITANDNGNGNGRATPAGTTFDTDSPPDSSLLADLASPPDVRGVPEIRVMEPAEEKAPSLPTPTDQITGAGAPQSGRLGNYIVLRELGRGGMGVVYQARHARDTEAKYAIKFIRKDLSRNELYLRRFQREISLVLSLSHPNIVETFETGVKDGFHYLVMEYVPGENLGDVLDSEGRLPVSRAVNIVRQTAMALASAHRQGVVHRDIKPDNIILVRQTAGSEARDFIKITDFGLAKDLTGFDDNLTVTGQLIGTPHYMSPEQCRGEYSDQRSDIYSLGCAFFHLVTGRPPFIGDNSLAVMEQQKNAPISLPHEINPSVPLSISFIIGKMMEKDPNSRYPTMDLLLAHLELWDSDKLVDEIARYAPSFSKVKAFGRREEFVGGAKTRQEKADFEAELRGQRAENEQLKARLDRFENFVKKWRQTRLILLALTGLFTMAGVILGFIIGQALGQ